MRYLFKKIVMFIMLGMMLILTIYIATHPDMSITTWIENEVLYIFAIVSIVVIGLIVNVMVLALHFVDRIFGVDDSEDIILPLVLTVPIIIFIMISMYSRVFFAYAPAALLSLQGFQLHKKIKRQKSLVSKTKLRYLIIISMMVSLWFLTILVQISLMSW